MVIMGRMGHIGRICHSAKHHSLPQRYLSLHADRCPVLVFQGCTSSAGSLLSEVGFLDAGVGSKFVRRAFHDNGTGFQNVGTMRMLQGGVSILLYKKDRGPFL